MKILHRYIAKSIIVSTFMVILVLTALTFFIGLLTELRDVGVGDYTFSQVILHEFLRLPYSIYQFFPMCMLLGGMIGLGMLNTHRELTVMRASGLSLRQMIYAIVVATIVMIIFAMSLGEGFAPKANNAAQVRKDLAQSGGQAVATVSGLWIHEGDNFLHIDRVVGKKHLEGVTRYEFDPEHRLLAAYYARALDFQHGEWTLHDMVKTTFNKDKTTHQSFAETTWDLKLNPNHLNIGYIEPQEMSLKSLLEYSRHLKRNGLQATEFQFVFWKRVLQPLATIIMILLALPFVMDASRSVTMGWRIMLGVMVGFVFYMLNAFLGQLSIVFQLPPFAAAFAPILVFGVVCYVVLSRMRS